MPNIHLAPHDKFFRSIMVDPKVAKEFFEQNLPLDIKAVVDLEKIQLQKESYISDKLRLQITDLLYSVEFGGKPGYLYILVEHQSKPDKFIAFRLVKYMMAIMEDHLKKSSDGFLPVIYPCVFYTGNKSHNCSTDLFDLFGNNKELAQDILWNPYHLIDLSKTSDEKLKEFLRYGVIARTMKHIHEKDFLIILRDIIGDLKAIEGLGEMDYIYTILSYIIEAGEVHDKQEFVKIVQAGLSKVSEVKVMTLADIFRQEGREEGIKEGYQKARTLADQFRQEGREEGIKEGFHKARTLADQFRQAGRAEGIRQGKITVAIRLLNQGLSIDQITAATGLSSEEIELLKNKSFD